MLEPFAALLWCVWIKASSSCSLGAAHAHYCHHIKTLSQSHIGLRLVAITRYNAHAIQYILHQLSPAGAMSTWRWQSIYAPESAQLAAMRRQI